MEFRRVGNMQDEEQLNLWDEEPAKEVPKDKLDLLDTTIKELAEARAKKDEAESKYNIESANCKVIEDKLMGLLKACERDSFKTPGIGTVSITHRQNFQTPKTGVDKHSLFEYIKTKYGNEALRSMLSIHSATLNSWAKKEIETGVLTIPGLGQPTMTELISFRREIK